MDNIHVKLYVIWTSGLGEMSFEEKVYRQTTKDRRRPIRTAHPEPLVQVS